MKLTTLARDLNLRLDAKAVRLLSKRDALDDKTIPLQAIAEVSELPPSEKPAKAFAYHEISSVDDFGLGEPYWIDEATIERGSEEERILAKVDKGDIALPQVGTILIPKVRPHLAKFVLVKDISNTYYTRAFLEARPKGISPELLYCILKHPAVLNQISSISSIGKGYPTISPFDLTRFVRVPLILLAIDPEVDAVIRGEVDELFGILLGLRKEREIIDIIFEERLAYKVPEGLAVSTTSFSRSRSNMGISFDMRMSAHFTRPSSVDLIKLLWQWNTVKIVRLCALPISLGVSPELYLEESGYYYLGPQAMTAERLDPEKLSMTSEDFYKALEPRFGVRYGDVFLRRSGASLGKVLYFDSNLPCIFSDFMMRIRFYDPTTGRYAAYWMRSTLFQRLVRAMAVIGKGLQNIYPYQVELMPIPSPEKYDFKGIVAAIDDEISKNDQLRSNVQKRIAALEERLSRNLNFVALE
jgi:hypothetical protein